MGCTDEDEERQLEKMRKRQERYWVYEFMPCICQYCGAALATERNLKRHLETSKKCKAVRDKNKTIGER